MKLRKAYERYLPREDTPSTSPGSDAPESRSLTSWRNDSLMTPKLGIRPSRSRCAPPGKVVREALRAYLVWAALLLPPLPLGPSRRPSRRTALRAVDRGAAVGTVASGRVTATAWSTSRRTTWVSCPCRSFSARTAISNSGKRRLCAGWGRDPDVMCADTRRLDPWSADGWYPPVRHT